MTDVNPGDFIAFTTIVEPAVTKQYKDQQGASYPYEVSPATWVEQSGSGIVVKVNKAPKAIGGVKHRTARVDAGAYLGKVTVSIDDAVIVGQQTSLDIGYRISEKKNIYSTDTEGVA